MGSFIFDLILLIVFAAIGVYTIMRGGFSNPQGVVLFIVGLVFLIAALVVGLALAGITGLP